MILNAEQKNFYDDNGYLVVQGAFTAAELDRLDRGVYAAVRSVNGNKTTGYTIEGQYQDDPDLLFIAEHPAVVRPVESLLGGPACLSAFISYLKTPGTAGTRGDYQGSHPTGHCDYKTYQQAGSSLNWLFTIIPLTDLDEQSGLLLVSPGSHRASKIVPITDKVNRVNRAQSSEIAPLIDTHLRRGDLCFMHGFTWHEGKRNRSLQDRYGIYNKYRAINAPPGCGPQLFREKSFGAFSEAGRRLVPHHGDQSFAEARLIVEHAGNFLLMESDSKDWKLPGTTLPREELKQLSVTAEIIARLECAIRETHGFEIPWMTYVADYPNGEGICRVYAYVDTDRTVTTRVSGPGVRWCGSEEVRVLAAGGELAAEDADAVRRWETEDCLRGIGESPARAKRKG